MTCQISSQEHRNIKSGQWNIESRSWKHMPTLNISALMKYYMLNPNNRKQIPNSSKLHVDITFALSHALKSARYRDIFRTCELSFGTF